MRYIYDQIHEHELAKVRAERTANTLANTDSKTGHSMDVVVHNNTNDTKDEHSIISNTFMGRMVTTFKCLVCHNESKHKESFHGSTAGVSREHEQ